MDITITNSTEGWSLSVSPVFIISFHAFYILVCLPLNVYIIVFLFPGQKEMEAADIFTLNQAIAEICFVLFVPFQILCSLSTEWCFFKPMGFLMGISLCSRALFHVFVCLERYVAVVHPLTFLRFKPIRYRIECCIFGWTVAVATAINCMLTSPNLPYNFYTALYVGNFALNVFFFVSILKKSRHPGPGDNESGEMEMNSFKRKTFQVVSLNLLAFLIQVSPMAVSCGLKYNVSISEFNLISIICLAISINLGFVQPIFVLQRVGKLSMMKHVWIAKRRTPYLTCC